MSLFCLLTQSVHSKKCERQQTAFIITEPCDQTKEKEFSFPFIIWLVTVAFFSFRIASFHLNLFDFQISSADVINKLIHRASSYLPISVSFVLVKYRSFIYHHDELSDFNTKPKLKNKSCWFFFYFYGRTEQTDERKEFTHTQITDGFGEDGNETKQMNTTANHSVK